MNGCNYIQHLQLQTKDSISLFQVPPCGRALCPSRHGCKTISISLSFHNLNSNFYYIALAQPERVWMWGQVRATQSHSEERTPSDHLCGGIGEIMWRQKEKKRHLEFPQKRKINLPGKKKLCCRFCAHENLNKYPQEKSATVHASRGADTFSNKFTSSSQEGSGRSNIQLCYFWKINLAAQ